MKNNNDVTALLHLYKYKNDTLLKNDTLNMKKYSGKMISVCKKVERRKIIMNFSKLTKKILAYVCVAAMVFASFTEYQANVKAAIPEGMTEIDNTKDAYKPDGTEWQFYFGGAGGTAGTGAFKGGTSLTDPLDLYVEKTSGNDWGIQVISPEITGLTAETKYQYTVKFTASKEGTLYSKENISNSDKLAQAFKAGENTIKGTFTAGGATAVVLLDMKGVESDTLFNITEVSVTDNFVEESTTPQTVDKDGYYLTKMGGWTTTLPWQFYTANGNTKYKGTAEGNTVTADFNFIAAGGGDWQTQAKIPGESKLIGPLEAGPEGTAYKVKVEYTASKEFSANLQLAGADNKVTFEEGTHSLTVDYLSKVDYPTIFMNLGSVPENTILKFTLTFEKVAVEETTTPGVEEPTTPGVEEPTTPGVEESTTPSVEESTTPGVEETTTPSVEETTTPKAEVPTTTAKNNVTTVPTTTVGNQAKATVKVPGQVKLAKKITKKNAAKKIKITFKKVADSKGYEVRISTSKKFKKIIVKKTYNKVKFTIKNKKLAKKKKLYVQVRAYALDGKTRVYGKWSKAVKVRVK